MRFLCLKLNENVEKISQNSNGLYFNIQVLNHDQENLKFLTDGTSPDQMMVLTLIYLAKLKIHI